MGRTGTRPESKNPCFPLPSKNSAKPKHHSRETLFTMPFAGAIPPCSILLLLLLVPCAEGQPPEAIEQILSENGCGAFAGLVAATAGVGQVFRSKSADGAGLTIFCPDDGAVAAFVPRFNNLTAGGRAALLLYHGLPARCSEKALRFIDWEVPTLDRGAMLTIFDHGGTVMLSSSRRSLASVTKMVVDDAGLAVYLIDAVLVPIEPTAMLDTSDIVLLCIFVGPLVLFSLLGALLYLYCLLSRLRRSCQECVTTYVSAARVAPHGQQEQ